MNGLDHLEMGRADQLDELSALESIFYSDEFQIINKDDNKDIHVILWAHVSLPEDYLVKYKENLEVEDYSYIEINYLPPIKLDLTLPGGYPLKCSPNFTISCQWLTRSIVTKLCQQLDKMWKDNENMPIIFLWVNFLKNDALEFLGFVKELDLTDLYLSYLKYVDCRNSHVQSTHKKTDNEKENIINSPDCGVMETKRDEIIDCKKDEKDFIQSNSYDERACPNMSLTTSPLKLVIHYNADRKDMEFMKKYFMCNICFSDHLGIDCIKFEECNHVFCKSCVCCYFTEHINNGTVHHIKCPETECSTDATPFQVRTVVSPELYAKYDSLLLQSALDSLEHVIYCPRTACQYPTTRDPEDNLVICPSCHYVFCPYCRKVYHGVEPCRLESGEIKLIVEKYLNATKDVKEKMEHRYGLKHIQTMVNNSMAESWIQDNCKTCPNCQVSIEKSHGCNRMMCWKCGTYFCWLCSAELDPADQYFHFNDVNSRCVNKLFYLTPLGGDELEDYNSDDEQWHDWDWI